jgi:hypothetical protein
MPRNQNIWSPSYRRELEALISTYRQLARSLCKFSIVSGRSKLDAYFSFDSDWNLMPTCKLRHLEDAHTISQHAFQDVAVFSAASSLKRNAFGLQYLEGIYSPF